jgi:hypothetical protein
MRDASTTSAWRYEPLIFFLDFPFDLWKNEATLLPGGLDFSAKKERMVKRGQGGFFYVF